MSLWRAKQQEVGSKPAPVKEVLKVAEPSGLVVALAERLAVQRGRPADTPTHAPSTSPRSLERGDSTESKSAEHEYRRSTPMDFEAVLTPKLPTPKSLSHSADGRAPSQSNPTQLPPKPLSQAQPILSLLQRSPQASVEPSEVTGAAPATPVALIKAPAVVRERKPLDMAESARKLLAMRAQQAASGAQSSADADGNNSDGGGAGTMSPSAANVLSILSAVGKARIAGGLLRTETAPQVLSYLFSLLVLLVASVDKPIKLWEFSEKKARTQKANDSESASNNSLCWSGYRISQWRDCSKNCCIKQKAAWPLALHFFALRETSSTGVKQRSWLEHKI
jgi:hypothetical protein